MKKFTTLLLLACMFQQLDTQNDSVPLTSLKEQEKLDKANSRRTQELSFSRQTLNYSPRSYVCPPYFDLGSPKKWYIFSADIIPDFIISGSRMPVTIHLVARYMVRILHDDPDAGDSSFAVRTPSFMPGAIVYIPLGYIDDKVPNIKYLGISIFHHSNGQDGDEFKGDGSFNLYDGNFSTNYIEPSFHFRRRKYSTKPLPSTQMESNPDYKDFFGSAGLELHFSTADSLTSSYGNQRVNLELGYISVINYWDKYKGHRLDNNYYGENYRIVFNAIYIGEKGTWVYQAWTKE